MIRSSTRRLPPSPVRIQGCLAWPIASHTLWLRGYPDQALMRSRQALELAQHLSHPFSLALAHCYAAMLHQFRREPHLVQQQAEAAMSLCTEQGFTYYLAWATIMQGWALTVQSAERANEDAMAQLRQGFADLLATGAGIREAYYRALLAEAAWSRGNSETGQQLLPRLLLLCSVQRNATGKQNCIGCKGICSDRRLRGRSGRVQKRTFSGHSRWLAVSKPNLWNYARR